MKKLVHVKHGLVFIPCSIEMWASVEFWILAHEKECGRALQVKKSDHRVAGYIIKDDIDGRSLAIYLAQDRDPIGIIIQPYELCRTEFIDEYVNLIRQEIAKHNK